MATDEELPSVETETITRMFVIALKGNYGFLSADRKARQGHFFHASQLQPPLGFKNLEVGQTVEVFGSVFGAPPKTSIRGAIYGEGGAGEMLAARERLQKSAAFSQAHQMRKNFRPSPMVVDIYLKGGWEAVDAFYAAEAAAEQARQPPARLPFSKVPVRQLGAPRRPANPMTEPPPGVFEGNKL